MGQVIRLAYYECLQYARISGVIVLGLITIALALNILIAIIFFVFVFVV